MKEGWTYKKLGEICQIGIGRTPSRSDSSLWDKDKSTHNYWVSIADMGAAKDGIIYDTKEYISDKAASSIQIIPKGTLLLSFKLTLGKTAIAGKDLYTNEAIANLPFVSQEVDREFLSYYFQYFNWGKFSAGDEKVLGKTLNKKKLDILPVMFPSFSEQKLIVSRLDAAFAHIDEIKVNAKEQISEARKLFQRCLAKAMEPKEGWEEKRICDIADTCLGKMLDKAKNKGSFQPYLRNLNVRWDGFNFDDILEMKFEEGEDERYGIKKGDLIVCEGGEPGRCAIWYEEIANMKIQKALHRVRPHKGMDSRFILYTFMLYSINGIIEKHVIGATIKHLTGQVLKNLIISFPHLSEQQHIVARLDALSAHVKELEEVNQEIISECDALKQSMLRKVFE